MVAFYREQGAKDWREFLWGFFDLSPSSLANEPAFPSEPEAITLSALEQALAAGQLSLAYQLYTPLVRTGILSQEKVLDLLLSLASRLENSPTQDPQQRLQACLKLREMAFELDPSRRDNTQVLLMRTLQAQDELAVGFYGQALAEQLASLGEEQTLDITQEPLLTQLLTRLWDDGYLDLFFEVATALQARLLEDQKSGFAALLAQLAHAVDPEQANRYKGLWIIEDLIGDFFQKAACALFQNSTSDGYSILGEALITAAESSQVQENFTLRLSLLSESLEKLIHAAQPERINLVIQKIIDLILSREADLGSLRINDENLLESLTIAKVILFRVCFCWSYLTDDRSLIRRYQQIGGRIFNDCLSLMASQRDFLWSEYWQRNQQDYCRSGRAERKLRVGFLGNCFQRHSVGFLSEATLRNLSRDLLDVVYYYYYQGWKNEDMASHDNMYQKFRSHENLHFRFFPGETNPPQVAAQAREDRIDIMVFMDSLTSHDASIVAALRAAPIQIGWLGGDAVGLPEFDYFFADPYILPEDAQADYHEKIIRLPSYCAVEYLDITPADEVNFKNKLRIGPQDIVFLTAASAYKRTPECIDAHLQILKAVPKGILIVKGSGEIATVIRRYQERAKELDVLDRVRFLAKTGTVEEHRGQLALVDLVLDTFPYTGATHTMEALYMGVPVLTLVGRHYYGRMSYSLLKNVGLEDCITWSVEEFIQRGIQLGNDPEWINRIKRQIKDSRRWSVIWDPREHARSMEAAFFHILEGKSHETYTFHPNDLYSTPDEWNQAGIQLIRSLSADASVSTHQSAWEEALSLWRRGLARDPYHVPCWLNRIHALLVLGDRSRAFEDAYALLEFLCTEAQSMQPSQLTDVPIWVESEGSADPGAYTKYSYLYYLAKWMAAHVGVVYSPEAMRFWNLAYSINPDDRQAALAVAIELLSQKKIEGLIPVNHILGLDPTHQQASLVKQIAMWEVVPQVKTASSPAQPDLYFDYENCKLFLEPSFSSIVTRVLLAQGEWFEDEISFCKHFLRQGMNVIDVGANVGVYTFLAAHRVGPTGSVIAIEPTASCLQCMRKTISASSLEDVVFLIEAAAGDHEGTVQLQEERASVFNSIGDSKQRPEQVSNDGKVVNLITLNSVWRSRGEPQIDLIKIDAEGAEEQVVSGGLELLAAGHPIVIFENEHVSKVTGTATAKILEPLGYEFYTYNRFLNKLTMVRPQQYPVSALNIIAIHPLDLEKVADMISV
ncbi:FkbM family methyltransferase [Synechococcus sp. JA-2-3B'a(2-13)]|uniref:FkbM family methyltransferase n=1 Tax=Synechococcus sp. (strain JA-2-3B'a(2-13)) TaxID=321332 RepID=UPI0016505A70|nr:FkbM family methyltransferase [Synechococcus sp. JA-2-3B'a(2-13)]